MTIFEKADTSPMPPGTQYVFNFDGLRQASIRVPDDLTHEEAGRLIQAIHDHRWRQRSEDSPFIRLT